MECDENQLTELDISQNTRWTHLRCNDNKLTSLSFNENVVMPPVPSIYTSNNRYQIAVDADGIYDLSQLPGNFDVSKTSDWTNGERNGTELKVTPGSTTVTYKYNTGSAPIPAVESLTWMCIGIITSGNMTVPNTGGSALLQTARA